jgi:hypothetical protein
MTRKMRHLCLWQIRTFVPHLRVLCATPTVPRRNVWPQAVLFPNNPLPYALVCDLCHTDAWAGDAVSRAASNVTMATWISRPVALVIVAPLIAD